MADLRTFINRAGIVYDPLKTHVVFAEDMNAISDKLSNISQTTESTAIDSIFVKLPLTSLVIPDETLYSVTCALVFLETLDIPNLTNVILSFSITGGVLNTLTVSNLAVVGDSFLIVSTVIISLDLSSLTTVGGSCDLSGNSLLTSIDLSSLSSVVGLFSLGSNALTSIDLSGLTSVGGLSIYEQELISLDLSNLVSVSGATTISGNALTSIDLSGLTHGLGMSFSNMLALETLNLSNLIDNNGTPMSFGTLGLTSLDLSAYVSISGEFVGINSCEYLTTLLISNSIASLSLYFQLNAFDQTCVDNILLAVDTAGYSGGILDLSGGTNSAPTDGVLNANYVSLLGKGWTVYIN